jgi:hypothetical protein
MMTKTYHSIFSSIIVGKIQEEDNLKEVEE